MIYITEQQFSELEKEILDMELTCDILSERGYAIVKEIIAEHLPDMESNDGFIDDPIIHDSSRASTSILLSFDYYGKVWLQSKERRR